MHKLLSSEYDQIISRNLFSYLYISKSWSVVFIVPMLQLSHISIHVIIIFSFQFSYNFFNNFFLNIYTFFNQSPSLTFHLSTTLYLNITIHLSFHLPLFCLFLFTTSYYKFVIISSIFWIVFPSKKVISLSLSLSLSLWLLNVILLLHYKELKIVHKKILLFYYIAWFG